MKIEELANRSEIELRMPVWTPGSYLIREYAQHVQRFRARDGKGRSLGHHKIDKATWSVDVDGCQAITVEYEVYGYELSPRHNHLDNSHGFFNCVATCFYLDDRMDEPVGLEVRAPKNWEVFCGLERRPGDEKNVARFVAANFDELFDTPVEMGPHRYFDFEVRGVPHRFVVWSDDRVDMEPFRQLLPSIIEQNASLFGQIPYERYVFINHVIPNKWGGLEHRHSSVNLFPPDDLRTTDRDEEGEFEREFANVLRLLSHEHYHAYHVKRLRPLALGPFDYQRENYTRALWAVEGVTSYFDTYHLMLAGIIGARRYLDLLEKRIAQLHEVPGRHVQSLEDSSFDAWIGLYRRNENTNNATVSYYLKGELVAWLIDLWIRDQSDGEHVLADALRQLWNDYYLADDVGYPPGAGERAIGEMAGCDAAPVFDHLVRSADPIEWEQFLGPHGLKLEADRSSKRAWLGMKIGKKGSRRMVKFVAHNSPAERAGLYAGDEIIACDGWSVRGADIDEIIGAGKPGQEIDFHVLRRGRLVEVAAIREEPPEDTFHVVRVEEPSQRQLRLLDGWLGETEWDE